MILTALGLEYRAVREYLVEVEEARHETGTVFEVGTLAGTSWRVALVEAGEGNRSAAVVTEQARQLFSPDALLFVGVAGALKDDVALGDVVVATRVDAFHGGKMAAGGFLPRPEVWSGSHALLQTARHALRGKVWRKRPRARGVHGRPRVFFKPIAAGDVVLNSPRSLLRERLHEHYNDVVAIEMESAGMAHAAQIGGMEALTIRGISDRADGTKCADDDAERQPRAAAHAAAAAVAILRHHHRPAPPPSGAPVPSTRRPPRRRAAWLARILASPKVRGAAAGVGVFVLLLGSAHYAGYLPNAGVVDHGKDQATGTPGNHSTPLSQPSDPDEPRPSPTPSPPPSPAPDTSPSDVPTPSPSPSSSTPSPSPPPPEDPPRPGPTAPTVRVRWQGTLSLYSNGAPMGWWLDNAPPTRALIGDLGLECDCHPGEVVANAIAAWDGPQQPRYQQCSEMSGQLARRALTVQVGSMACLRTQNGRLGYFTVTSMPGPSQVNVEATVWDRG
ncbi:5'-methylthioadenosine/S-adenosylhomocysteine nucleosidase [Streptomyces sp. SAJ15]|uniref:5'-methylthioadenosine/S-adenosylhomocysteine nucleosidase n=1 Tax=Streptomyces sp. SAJ15 TaxID=2011095 RepID=UPI0016429982|nr:5'-methylthioadenosine/S-adenosylhomocysteine nucleosidase [Streptomyces sp. SAJ15]